MRNEINRYSRWLQGIFSLFLLLFAVTAFAQTETFPRMQGSVTDTAGLLTAGESSSIEQKLNALRERTGTQIAVLTVNTTGSRDIESYAEKVFSQWRLGRINIDDGILLLVASDDRAMRIEVGYGLEGAVSDAVANRILKDYFIPNFKMGNYAGGINDTVDALIARVRNEPLPPVTTPAFFIAKQAGPVGWIDIVLGAVLAASAYLWGTFLYRMVKRFKLKAAIPIAIILYLTWYAGGFNNPAGNGIHFGEDFLYTELPRWSQFLFLQILPFWLVIVLTFTMFIAAFFLFLDIDENCPASEAAGFNLCWFSVRRICFYFRITVFRGESGRRCGGGSGIRHVCRDRALFRFCYCRRRRRQWFRARRPWRGQQRRWLQRGQPEQQPILIRRRRTQRWRRGIRSLVI